MRDNEQANPFIPREEFLMNRIVQRQGAAPPWVELQQGKIIHSASPFLFQMFRALACLFYLEP